MIHDVVEDEPYDVNGTEVPIDTSQPNPNGRECVRVRRAASAALKAARETNQLRQKRSRRAPRAAAADARRGACVRFDNLYLDMNGIIHPCFHPEDRVRPWRRLHTHAFLSRAARQNPSVRASAHAHFRAQRADKHALAHRIAPASRRPPRRRRCSTASLTISTACSQSCARASSSTWPSVRCCVHTRMRALAASSVRAACVDAALTRALRACIRRRRCSAREDEPAAFSPLQGRQGG
jgi:hypothetical protein